MSKHLFIGGTHDGTTHEVEPDVNFPRLSVEPKDPPPYDLFAPTVFASVIGAAGIETYRREKFAVGNRIVAQIFVFQHMSTEGMFEALLTGYRQGIPADPGEAYEAAFERGRRFGVLSSVRTIEDQVIAGGRNTIGAMILSRTIELLRALVG